MIMSKCTTTIPDIEFQNIEFQKRRWKSLSKDEQKSERADKRRKNKELGDATALIIEGFDGEKLNPNKFIIQDFNSSDTTLDIFDDSSNFI